MKHRMEVSFGGSCTQCNLFKCNYLCDLLRELWGRDNCPEDTHALQIEISPADEPTREEMIEALREFSDWVNVPTKTHPADTMGKVESLLSRCKEADYAN